MTRNLVWARAWGWSSRFNIFAIYQFPRLKPYGSRRMEMVGRPHYASSLQRSFRVSAILCFVRHRLHDDIRVLPSGCRITSPPWKRTCTAPGPNSPGRYRRRIGSILADVLNTIDLDDMAVLWLTRDKHLARISRSACAQFSTIAPRNSAASNVNFFGAATDGLCWSVGTMSCARRSGVSMKILLLDGTS